MKSYMIGSGRVFYSLIIFLLTVFASRYFNIQDYGAFREFYLYFVALIAISAIPAINPIFYFRTRNRNILLAIILFSLLIAGIGLAGLHLALHVSFLFVLALSVPAAILYLLSEAVLLVSNRHRYAFLMTIAESLTFAVPIPFILILQLDLNTYMAVFSAISGVKIVFYSVFLILVSDNKAEDIRKLSRYSLPIYMNSFVGMVSTRIDKYVVSGLFGTEIFAYYSSGAFEIPLINRFITGVFHSIAGEIRLLMEQGRKNEVKEMLRNKMFLLCMGIGILGILFTANARDVITLLYSSKYSDSYIFFILYLSVLPLRIVPVGFLLSLTGRTRALMYISIADAVLTVALSVLLISMFGPAGGAYAFAFITVLQIMVMSYMMRDIFPAGFFIAQYLFTLMFMNISAFMLMDNYSLWQVNLPILIFIPVYWLLFRRLFR